MGWCGCGGLWVRRVVCGRMGGFEGGCGSNLGWVAGPRLRLARGGALRCPALRLGWGVVVAGVGWGDGRSGRFWFVVCEGLQGRGVACVVSGAVLRGRAERSGDVIKVSALCAENLH